MLDLLGDLIEGVIDFFSDGGGGEVIGDVIAGGFSVLSDALLIGSVVYVASLTADSIRSELSNRRELKAKGVTNVVIQDFINQSGYTEISLAALNAQNQQVGTVKMKTSGYTNVKKGQKIQL